MKWRLILDGEYSGAWNMARDEALLLCQGGDATNGETTIRDSTPVLRFYSWNPACVSLGRLQKNIDFERVQSTPFDVVRRPTGGRAVLHQREVTYCAVIHEQYLPRESRSVIGAYEWLSAGFLEGFKLLGIEAQLSPAHTGRDAPTNCFNAAAQCDFLVEGKKLIGAAQCRKNDVILQHGAILLDVDEASWQNTIGGAMKDAVSLRRLGVLVPREEIVHALCDGMKRAADISFTASGLTDGELQVARRLHAKKYSCREWNEHGQIGDCT